ncbi:D-alanine--D-alanine ligase [bacterium]|nr:D-alanine--D-alanine ligase [bacterium]
MEGGGSGRHRGRRIGVLRGGLSSEREISLRSARAVENVLRERGYDVVSIDVGRDLARDLRDASVEVAFNALHGRYGEDGCVQGLLETMAIPYTGAGVMGSAVAMDKWTSKQMLRASGVPTAPAALLRRGDDPGVRPAPYPLVFKPRGEGSSNGVSIAHDASEAAGAAAEARRFDDDVIVEAYVPGREVTVAILDDRALAAMEVVPLGDEMHSYEVKYTPGREEFLLPAPLGDRYQATLDAALAAHRALSAGPYGRVDLRVRDDGEAFVLECNTLPGLHELGWFPAMAKHVGIAFPDLIETILDRAALHVRETSRGGAA